MHDELSLHQVFGQIIQRCSIYILFKSATMRSDKETVLDISMQPRTGQQFDRRQTDKELVEIIKNKNEQIAILHQVNTRLGYELALLQKRLGVDHMTVLKELQKIGDISVAYHSQLEQLQYLDQLLLAYDQTILKQKKIIAMLYSQLEDAEHKAESFIREKEYLLEENKNKCKKILEIYHRGFPEENLTTSYIKLLRDMENEKNLLIREESEHILDAYRQLENHSIDIQGELEEEKTNATTYFQLYKKQAEQLKQALMSVDNLLKVKDFLQKTVNKLGDQNITLQTAKTQMEARIGKLQSELKSLRSQIFNQKKIARQDTERASIQVDSLRSQTQNATKRQRQTFNKMMIVEKELQNAKDSLRSLKRQNQKIKSDFEQTLKMCEAYQSKITSSNRREENIRDIIDQSKQKLDSLLLQRDKALLKVEQLEKIMQNMSERHRHELTKQRENYEKMLYELQQQIKIITDQKEEGESIFMESELSYKNQIEKLKRQNSILHEQNIKFIENIHVNTGSEIISKLKEYQSKNDSLMKMLNQKERALKEQENKYEEATHQYQGQVRNINRLLDKEKSLTTQYMKELTQERSRVNILTNQRECLENEIKKLKKNYEFKNGQFNDERQYRIHELQNKLGEAVKKEKETRQKAIEMLEKYDEAEEKLKSQYEKRIVELQSENEKIKKKLAKLRQ